jgi:hypothetical protein
MKVILKRSYVSDFNFDADPAQGNVAQTPCRPPQMEEQQDAATSAAWRAALKTLQLIPLAVADRSVPQDQLYWLTSQAGVDCTRAELPAARADDLTSPQQLQLAAEQTQQMGRVSTGTGHSSRCVAGGDIINNLSCPARLEACGSPMTYVDMLYQAAPVMVYIKLPVGVKATITDGEEHAL